MQSRGIIYPAENRSFRRPSSNEAVVGGSSDGQPGLNRLLVGANVSSNDLQPICWQWSLQLENLLKGAIEPSSPILRIGENDRHCLLVDRTDQIIGFGRQESE